MGTEQWQRSLKKCTLVGNVPLHVACISRAPLSVVRYLAQQYNLAKTMRNRKKQTPLDCAVSESNGKAILPHVVKFLDGDTTTVKGRSTASRARRNIDTS